MEYEELGLLKEKISSLMVKGKYKAATESCYELLEIAKTLGDYKAMLSAYVNLASAYYCVGDYEMSFEAIMSHEEITNAYGDEVDMLNNYNIVFLLHEYNKDRDKAKATLKKSIELGKKLEKYNIVSNAYSNYSHICMMDNDYEEALHMAEIGLEMAKLHVPKSILLEIRVRLNIGKANIGLKNLKLAKEIIDGILGEEALGLYIREKSQAHDLLGHWYSAMDMNLEAFKAFTDAKKLVETYTDVHLLKDIQEERCRLSELLGDLKLAFVVQKEYIELLREINKRELDQIALKHEIRRSINAVEKQAKMDYLTGAYNRRYLEETANKWFKKAIKKNENILCMVYDIDNFKNINDTYGHLEGDKVIKKVVEVLKNRLRSSDLIARYGGDEFVVVLRGITIELAIKRAEQILGDIRELNVVIEGKAIETTATVGIKDIISCKATDFSELFYAADKNMYYAKENGKNQVCYK